MDSIIINYMLITNQKGEFHSKEKRTITKLRNRQNRVLKNKKEKIIEKNKKQKKVKGQNKYLSKSQVNESYRQCFVLFYQCFGIFLFLFSWFLGFLKHGFSRSPDWPEQNRVLYARLYLMNLLLQTLHTYTYTYSTRYKIQNLHY